ncbi:anhydro-N-acetylmuramic acid kinase [Nemorincola caseinilytica]|uniref:anhydro-N-acetylmuramic acid kinase n=1 Tax=Nemorincola caseinilytica TaxID=2054315 RepID=UPI0031EFC8ED
MIGLMSGSSLDGLDIAYVQLEEVRGKWEYTILQAECIPYDRQWSAALKGAAALPVPHMLRLHTAYGRYTGEAVRAFMEKHDLEHKVHFIASHGHTVFHEPASNTTFQLGDGASIAAICALPVISDLRAMDVAHGGQGAPIVPVGDRLLFGSYDLLLNIGGIANITIRRPDGDLAFDVCPANQVINALAGRVGKTMDENGAIARTGSILPGILATLEAEEYYSQVPPRSLSNEQAMQMADALLADDTSEIKDLLRTTTALIAGRITDAVVRYAPSREQATMLVTGGGAFNTFLVDELQTLLAPYGVTLSVPDAAVVQYKEALVMALIGVLRWREEANVFSSVTGSSKDSVGGALWLPG